jgi:hypothetical protein
MTDTGNSNTFLLFSDVHFDPFADPSLVPALAAADVSAWKGILASSSRTAYASYGSDSNYALFESTLDDMAARAGDVSTILYPGDILSHNFGANYAALTGDKSQSGLDAFIQKTVAFFVQEVDSRFPDATVLVADGNCDSALGMIGSRPGDPYLSVTTASISQAFFNSDADRASFAATYAVGGYYAVEPDGPTGIKYIVLNDNLWVSQYDDPGPGAVELSWFASELADSAQNFQKVWVVAHIPTGADATAVANASSQTGQISYSGFLDNGFNNAFTALELAYDSTIGATFTGHLHNDDFRLITADDGSDAAALIRISPGISPYLGSNPGYQIYTYDTQTASLLDETTYNLNLQSSTPVWSKEYDYAETYGQGLATSQEWQAAYVGILTNPVSQAAYIDYRNQEATSLNTITAANASAYLLAPGFTTSASYNAAAAALYSV